MHILVGADGSTDALDAAVAGVDLLGLADRVTIACVVDAPPEATRGMESGFAGGIASDEETAAAWSEVHREAQQILDQMAHALPSGTPVEPLILEGDAGPALCRAAEELDVDVVVVGSRGRGAVKRALLGSVSSYVSHHAPCPVLITRAGTADAAEHGSGSA